QPSVCHSRKCVSHGESRQSEGSSRDLLTSVANEGPVTAHARCNLFGSVQDGARNLFDPLDVQAALGARHAHRTDDSALIIKDWSPDAAREVFVLAVIFSHATLANPGQLCPQQLWIGDRFCGAALKRSL